MTLHVEQTTVINVDDKTYQVSEMSAEIQQMVKYFDDWRERELNATSELLLIRGGLRDLQNSLLEAIQKEVAPAAAEPAPTAPKKTKRASK